MGRDGADARRDERAAARGGRARRSGARIFITRSSTRWTIAAWASPGLLRRYAGSERNYRIMIDNAENPYTTSPETTYRWGRSRCLGGRTLHWARATDRMADYEFKAASRDGYGMDWAGLLRRHEALLRSCRELHRRERKRWKASRSFLTASSCRRCRSTAPRRSLRRRARAWAGRPRIGASRS